jgi:hypothetical protein
VFHEGKGASTPKGVGRPEGRDPSVDCRSPSDHAALRRRGRYPRVAGPRSDQRGHPTIQERLTRARRLIGLPLTLATMSTVVQPATAATECFNEPCEMTCAPQAPVEISTLIGPEDFPPMAHSPTAFVDPGDGRGRWLIATKQGADPGLGWSHRHGPAHLLCRSAGRVRWPGVGRRRTGPAGDGGRPRLRRDRAALRSLYP